MEPEREAHLGNAKAINGSKFDAGGILDAFGFAKSKSFFWFVLLITALMVFLEAKYNVDLLNTLSNPNAESSAASDLSQRGKMLAAFGITWAIARGLLTKIRPFLAGLGVFLTLAVMAYHGLDYTYTRVIAGLDPEVKVMGFNLFSYRRDLLNGTLVDPDIPMPKKEPVIGKIFMGAFPMVILDDRFMLPAQDIVERKANDKQAEVLSIAEEKWRSYSASMRKLSNAHDDYVAAARIATGNSALDKEWKDYSSQMSKMEKAHVSFVEASKKAAGTADLSREWSSYQQNMNAIDDAYGRYIDGSRKVASYNYSGMAVRRFREQSNGLDPNPNLSRLQFVEMLKKSNHPKAEEIRRAEAREIGKNPDGTSIYAREIPYFLNRDGFNKWVAKRARDGLQSVGLEPDPTMSRSRFVQALRASNGTVGKDLRQREKKEIGLTATGEPVRVRDMPYFMPRDEFVAWSAKLAKDTLTANGFGAAPDPEMSKVKFVDFLRTTEGPAGRQLREAEKQEIGKRPDGMPVLAGEVPYFMGYQQYMDWVGDEARKAKQMSVPTKDTVENFNRIQEVNAAVFLPPMAVISSLTSALTNGISLILLISGMALTALPVTRRAGVLLTRFAMPVMVLLFAGLLYLMPRYVFDEGSPIRDLEVQFHEKVGMAGVVWSKLSNVQKYIL